MVKMRYYFLSLIILAGFSTISYGMQAEPAVKNQEQGGLMGWLTWFWNEWDKAHEVEIASTRTKSRELHFGKEAKNKALNESKAKKREE